MPVLTVPVTLQAGQTRLISDQLTVTVNRDDAEVENFVECIDPAGDKDLGVNAGGQPQAFNAGTNYQWPSSGTPQARGCVSSGVALRPAPSQASP